MKKTFGDKLRELRENKNITIQQMHIITGFARSTIYNWEQNKYYPSSYNISILAKFFKVPRTYFDYKKDDLSENDLLNILKRLKMSETRIDNLEKNFNKLVKIDATFY